MVGAICPTITAFGDLGATMAAIGGITGLTVAAQAAMCCGGLTGSSPPIPPTITYLATESGDILTTESGDSLILES